MSAEKKMRTADGAGYRSGFVCLVGRPNVGKSTLMNRLVGSTVSIATPKPQTTRTRIMGVLHGEDYQVVFIDTPGIHQAFSPLNKRMVGYALGALSDADLCCVLVEPRPSPGAPPGPEEQLLLDRVREAGRPALGLVNKVDAAGGEQVLATLSALHDTGLFAEVLPVSALTGHNLERLMQLILERLEPGPEYFPPGQISDQGRETMIGELIRQALMTRTRDEVPYGAAVRVESLEERTQGEPLLVVHASIFVERDSQKGIVIGKGGKMLKAIGSEARRRIENLLGVRIFLELNVRVLDRWSEDPRRLTELGYPED